MKKLNTTARFLKMTVMSAAILLAFNTNAQYCIPTYSFGTGEGDYCGYVGLGTIDNATDGAPSPFYTDYTALSTDITPGMTYTIYLGSGTYTSNNDLAAWIDYNQDGDFYDAGELVATVLDLGALAIGSADFTVPLDAFGGPTVMRVREIYAMPTPPDPCADYSFGETEDYTVNVTGGALFDVAVIDVTNPTSGADLGFEDVIVTVMNYGSEEASEFSVYYQVDGGFATGGLFLGSIPPYSTASYTMPEGWDFSADGCYEIHAWTEMEADENTDNDDYTETVCNLGPITGSGAVYIYSNVFGIEPWGSTTNTEAMNQAFGPEGVGWTRDYFETLDPLAVFNPDNCFVFMEGSDFMADDMETFLSANLTTIQDWVASGGKILINSAPNEGDGMSFGFDGVTLTYDGGAGSVTAADAGHPIFNGPYLPAGTDYTGTNFSHARVSGGGISAVIYETGSEDITLGEKGWGDGWVMFGGMTTTNWHDPDPNALNLRANIFNYLSCTPVAVCEPPGEAWVDGITDNDAMLHWSAVDGADQYRVVLWNTATGVIGKKGVYTTSYDLTDKLTPLTTYAFRVKTVCYDDLEDISVPTEWVYWTTLGRLGDVNSTVSLYPNPSNGVFTLQVGGYSNNEFELTVVDALGKIVYSKSVAISNDNYTEQISLDNLAGGMYQVRLVNSEYQMSYPVMILK